MKSFIRAVASNIGMKKRAPIDAPGIDLSSGDLAKSAAEGRDYYESIRVINELMENRMFPMTIEGLDSGIRELSR